MREDLDCFCGLLRGSLILSSKSSLAKFQWQIKVIHSNSVILVLQILKEKQHSRMKRRATVVNNFLEPVHYEKKGICVSLITYCIGKKPITLAFVINSLFTSMVAFKLHCLLIPRLRMPTISCFHRSFLHVYEEWVYVEVGMGGFRRYRFLRAL